MPMPSVLLRLAAALAAWLVAPLALCAAAASAQQPEPVAGYWRGEALLNGDRMPLDLAVEETQSGLSGYLRLPEMIWAAEVQVKADGDGLVVAMPFGLGDTPLRLAADGQVLASGEGGPRFTLRRIKPPAIVRTPVVVPSPGGPLQGVFYAPEAASSAPAVVVAGGATQAEHDHGGVVAWCEFFVRRNIACLAHDRRPEGLSAAADLLGDAEDLASAVRLLRSRPEVDAGRVGLFAASRGAWPAMRVAAADPRIAFVLLSAPSAYTPAEAERISAVERARRAGRPEDQLRAIAAYYDLYFAAARDRSRWPELDRAARAAESAPWGEFVDQPLKPEHLDWWGRNADFDNAADFARIRAPVLAVWGERDVIVPPQSHRPRLEQAAPGVRTRVFPAADHPIETQSGPDAFGTWRWPRRAPGLVETIDAWLAERLAR